MKKKTEQNELTVNTENECVFVYLGPSIRGSIQNGQIFSGTKSNVMKGLSEAVVKYPDIATLIVADSEIMTVKKQLNRGGNIYSRAYKNLIK